MNKSYLKYNGETPVHALKKEWSRGSIMTLTDIFNLLGNKYNVGAKKPDMDFVQWVFDTYISKLGGNFEFVISKTELAAEQDESLIPDLSPEEQVELDNFNTNEALQESDDDVDWEDMASDKEDSVILESSELEVASSEKEAQNRLKSMRHPSVVGHVNKTPDVMKTNKTDAEDVKSFPKPFSNVLTGDDFEPKNDAQIGNPAPKASAFVLNESGQTTVLAPIDKLKEREQQTKMASMSSNFKVLGHDQLTSEVSLPSREGSDKASKGYAAKVVSGTKQETKTDAPKKNIHFQGHQGSVGQKEIYPEDIVRNASQKEAIKLIQLCKRSTVLKVARIQLLDKGNHRLVDEIDLQLRKLHPGQ